MRLTAILKEPVQVRVRYCRVELRNRILCDLRRERATAWVRSLVRQIVSTARKGRMVLRRVVGVVWACLSSDCGNQAPESKKQRPREHLESLQLDNTLGIGRTTKLTLNSEDERWRRETCATTSEINAFLFAPRDLLFYSTWYRPRDLSYPPISRLHENRLDFSLVAAAISPLCKLHRGGEGRMMLLLVMG